MTELKCVLDSFPQQLQLTCAYLEESASSYSSITKSYQSQQQQTSSSSMNSKNGSPQQRRSGASSKKNSPTNSWHEYPSDFHLSRETLPLHLDEIPFIDVTTIDRSWLEIDTPTKSNTPHQTYVPQVDDIVV
jgi:hypothetical protein